MSTLIVSDFDGTLKKEKEPDEFNKNLIMLYKLWKDNIKIMISTGRMYKSMSLEIQRYNIPFNYLSCANGNVLFDENYKLLFKTYINSKIIKDLQPFYKQILEIESLDEYGIITFNNPTEYLIHLIERQDIKNELVSYLLSSNEVDYCSDGNNKYDIHIFNLSNKTKTIEIIKNKLKLIDSEIYTIGDGPNDLDMIKKYNGLIIGDSLKINSNLMTISKYQSFYSCAKDLEYTLKRRNIK